MKVLKRKNYLLIGVLGIYLLSGLTACTANKPRSAWMDVPHAKSLDKKKGKRSKKIMKHEAHVRRR